MDEYTQFVLDKAKFHMRAAEELLTESIKDPEKHYRETKRFHADLAKLFPFMVLLKSFEPPLPDPEVGDNFQIHSLQSHRTKIVMCLQLHRVL